MVIPTTGYHPYYATLTIRHARAAQTIFILHRVAKIVRRYQCEVLSSLFKMYILTY